MEPYNTACGDFYHVEHLDILSNSVNELSTNVTNILGITGFNKGYADAFEAQVDEIAKIYSQAYNSVDLGFIQDFKPLSVIQDLLADLQEKISVTVICMEQDIAEEEWDQVKGFMNARTKLYNTIADVFDSIFKIRRLIQQNKPQRPSTLPPASLIAEQAAPLVATTSALPTTANAPLAANLIDAPASQEVDVEMAKGPVGPAPKRPPPPLIFSAPVKPQVLGGQDFLQNLIAGSQGLKKTEEKPKQEEPNLPLQILQNSCFLNGSNYEFDYSENSELEGCSEGEWEAYYASEADSQNQNQDIDCVVSQEAEEPKELKEKVLLVAEGTERDLKKLFASMRLSHTGGDNEDVESSSEK